MQKKTQLAQQTEILRNYSKLPNYNMYMPLMMNMSRVNGIGMAAHPGILTTPPLLLVKRDLKKRLL
jgi:hypothetical protein